MEDILLWRIKRKYPRSSSDLKGKAADWGNQGKWCLYDAQGPDWELEGPKVYWLQGKPNSLACELEGLLRHVVNQTQLVPNADSSSGKWLSKTTCLLQQCGLVAFFYFRILPKWILGWQHPSSDSGGKTLTWKVKLFESVTESCWLPVDKAYLQIRKRNSYVWLQFYYRNIHIYF